MSVTENIHRMQEFTASPNEPFIIFMTEVIFLAPVFRFNGGDWVDATGDYDLCLSLDGKKLEFISRRSIETRFLYRYISPFWFTARSGKQ